MLRRMPMVCLITLFLLSATLKAQEVPARGRLYQNWKKLGLTEKQTREVYKIQAEHRKQIVEQEAKIKEIDRKEKIAAIMVLSDAQRTRLAEVGDLEFRRLLKELKESKEDPGATKPGDVPKSAYRGMLYRNWKLLGLSKDQVEKIYAIQGAHKKQAQDIETKIKEIERNEKIAAIKVLTAGQKARLAEVGDLEFRQLLKELEASKDEPKKKDN